MVSPEMIRQSGMSGLGKQKTAIPGGFKDSVSVLLCRELTASPPPGGWGS
jgi:hypothetical protein